MLRLAQRSAELLVDWNTQLAAKDAWEGDFRRILKERMLADPPDPRFFAFVSSSITWPGVLADFLAAGYNINACTWLSASGPSQVELVVVDWFRRWLGYPEGAGGLFTSGGSAAAVVALVAARERIKVPASGCVYMSEETHSAVFRAAWIIGIPQERVRRIPCDRRFRIDVEALAAAVALDRAAGLHPLAVCANAGTSSSGAVDPLAALADYCEREGVWLHVDAAYGCFAVPADDGRALLNGIERADSVGLDAHKWFFQPYEAGCLMVKDIRTLEHAFHMPHDVLQDTVWGADHVNFADRGLQLSRSFRALKVWMSVQTFGMEAFREAVSRTMELAAEAGRYVLERPGLELLTPVSLGIVCFRVNPDGAALGEAALDGVNRAVLAYIFWEDRALISSTRLGGTFSLRLCIVNHDTNWKDVRETLAAVERFGRESAARQ